jgi:MFS-type transporter involved in bile tolerance (Atg22 family)
MIVSQIVSVLPILAAAAFFVFGYLLGGSDAFQFSYIAIYVLPLLLLIPIIGSWVAYKRRNEKLAWILTSIPVIYLCLELAIVGGGIFL